MTRDEALRRLAGLKPWLAEQGISRVRLFGSTARDQARADSDLDLLLDFEMQPGLRFFDLETALSEKMGVPVECATEQGLAPDVRISALRDALDA
jgi:predicted nucleotidyltransferase